MMRGIYASRAQDFLLSLRIYDNCGFFEVNSNVKVTLVVNLFFHCFNGCQLYVCLLMKMNVYPTFLQVARDVD